jgi:hypothetical protein
MVSVGALSATRSVLRVDVLGDDQPAKAAGDIVPVTPYLLVTVVPWSAVVTSSGKPMTVAVTDHAKIAEIAALVNGLPRFGAEVRNCAMIAGVRLVLDFKDTENGATRATVETRQGSCADVLITVGGVRGPNLDSSVVHFEGGLTGRVSSILGLAPTR